MSTSFRPWAKPFEPNLAEHHVFAFDPTAMPFTSSTAISSALSTPVPSIALDSTTEALTTSTAPSTPPPTLNRSSSFRPWARPFDPAAKEHQICLLNPLAPCFTLDTPAASSASDANQNDATLVVSKLNVNATTFKPGIAEHQVQPQAGISTNSELHGDAYEFLPGRKKHFENLRTSSTDPLRDTKCKTFLSYLSDPDFWLSQAQKSNLHREVVRRLRECATNFVPGASTHYVRLRSTDIGLLKSKLNSSATLFIQGEVEHFDQSSSVDTRSTLSSATALISYVNPLSVALASEGNTHHVTIMLGAVDHPSEDLRGLKSNMLPAAFGLCLRPNPVALCFFWMLFALWQIQQQNTITTYFDWADDVISASNNDDYLEASDDEYDPSQPMILYNGQQYHHIGFFGDVVSYKSDTSAALSLAIILKGAKPALAEENTEDLYTRALVQNARRLVDPIVDSSERGREDYASMSMSEIQKEATGQAHKLYLPGPWVNDHHDPDDDLILSDDEPCKDADMQVDFLRNVYGCRETIRSTSDTNGAVQRVLLRDEASEMEKAQRKPRQNSAWIPSSSLCLSFTPDSMLQAEKDSLIAQVFKLAFMDFNDEAALRVHQKAIIKAAAEEVVSAVWKSKYKNAVTYIRLPSISPTVEDVDVAALDEESEEEEPRNTALHVERPATTLGYHSDSDDDARYWEDVEPAFDDVEPIFSDSSDGDIAWLDLASPSEMFAGSNTIEDIHANNDSDAAGNFETSSMPDLTNPSPWDENDEDDISSVYLVDDDDDVQDVTEPEELHVLDGAQSVADPLPDRIEAEHSSLEHSEPSDHTMSAESSRPSSSEYSLHDSDSSIEAIDDDESSLLLEEKSILSPSDSAHPVSEEPAAKNATNLFGILTQAAQLSTVAPSSVALDSHPSKFSSPIRSYSLAIRPKPPTFTSEDLPPLPKIRQERTVLEPVHSRPNSLENSGPGRESLPAIQKGDGDQTPSEDKAETPGDHSLLSTSTSDRADANDLAVEPETLSSEVDTSSLITPPGKPPFSLRKYQKRKSDITILETIEDVPLEVDEVSPLQGDTSAEMGSVAESSVAATEASHDLGSTTISQAYTASSVPTGAARPVTPSRSALRTGGSHPKIFAKSSILDIIESSTDTNPFSTFDGTYTHSPYKYADTPFWNMRNKSTVALPSTCTPPSPSAIIARASFDTSPRDRLRQFSSQNHPAQSASRRKRFSAWFWKKLTPRTSSAAPLPADAGEGSNSAGPFGSIKSFVRSTLRRKK